MKDIRREFESEVAKAVALIMAASHKVAQAALDKAFSQSSDCHQGTKKNTRQQPGISNKLGSRRSSESVDAAADRLLQEIWATPGETIAALAERMGADPSELKSPVKKLKRLGKLRTVGVSQATRYFPVHVPNGLLGAEL